jgi:hypothetical protein
MMTNQITRVDPAGRSIRFGRPIREGRCPTVRFGSRSHVTSAILALLVALVLVGRDEPALGQAQEPAAANPAEPASDKQDVSQRYRFLERYSTTDDPTRPELLIQYKVGFRENVKRTREKPQGAPDRDDVSSQCIYTERVAKLGKGGLVAEVVRHYDKFNLKTSLDIPRYKTKLLEGLTVLLRVLPRSPLQVVCLAPSRQLRRQEYILVVQESFLPGLANILPRKASRVGDTWPVPREAASVLVGEIPGDEDYDLTAEILEVHKNGAGPSMVAVIGVKGRLVVSEGPSGINTRLQFTFLPSEVTAPPRARIDGETTKEKASGTPASPGGRVEAAIDAKGYISKISMAQEITVPLPGNDGRLKQNIRRDLVLERKVVQAGEVEVFLEVPDPEPVANVSNSWLIYDDPQGQYHFLHPQQMQVTMNYSAGGIDLVEQRHEGPDAIHLSLLPKTQDPQRDRLAADPIQMKKLLEDDWKRQRQKVVPGPSSWLPEADWSPLKRKVYRIEAALIPESDRSPSGGRIYFDQYIVQFTRDEAVVVTAMTTRDPHVQFRETVESIIKSFDLGPSDLSLPASPTRAPTTPSTRVPTTPSTRVPTTPRPR